MSHPVTSALTVRRQLDAPDAALAACWTAHQLQVGRADFQDSADVISTVSEPAPVVAHQRTQHSIVVRPTAVRAISTDIICQTIVQHCRNSLPPAVLNCDSLPTFKSRLKTHLFSTVSALWRYINFVLLLLLLYNGSFRGRLLQAM